MSLTRIPTISLGSDLPSKPSDDGLTGRNSYDGSASQPSQNSPAFPTLSELPTTSSATTTAYTHTKRPSVKLSWNSSKDGKDAKSLPRSGTQTGVHAALQGNLDPLSQHILVRTTGDSPHPRIIRTQTKPESPVSDANPPHLTDGLLQPPSALGDIPKDRKKRVSFLSRLGSMRSPKKKDDNADYDDDEPGLHRTDGVDALVFSSAAISTGYIPHHKEPPRYIRVKTHHKKVREFNHLFLAQELVGTHRPKPTTDNANASDATTSAEARPTQDLPSGKRDSKFRSGDAIWAMEFSKDGRYLAVAGQDRIIRIFAVISTHEERALEEEDAEGDPGGERLRAPVFRSKPIREFEGHTGEVLDLSWSKNGFLLSSSFDKTVRLWHTSRQECLCTFKHKDFVTSIAFHPRDDRFFLAGSLDTTLRLWSIPDRSVAFTATLPDLITAVAFSPDGKTCIAGVLSGLCLFYETEGFKCSAQIHVRSSRGKNAKGSKITGIRTMKIPPESDESEGGKVKVLITSNDSRIRIYDLVDKTLEAKFKGHVNSSSQMLGSFSDNAQYIICGSEDRKVFVWSTDPADSENRDKRPYECFDAHSNMVSAALFAPTQSRQLLGASGDPIYDLCNPPAVTLLSRGEGTAGPTPYLGDEQAGEHRPTPPQAKKPEESPGYIQRSTHYDGNILVTSDRTGLIKVFRQDCAFTKRKHDMWETSSTISKRLAAASGIPGRSGSIVTRSGSVPHSRRGSLSQAGSVPGSAVAARSTPHSTAHDHIVSWQQGVEPSRHSIIGTPTRSARSMSPTKRTSLGTATSSLASEARRMPYGASPAAPRQAFPTSPAASVQTNPLSDIVPIRENPPQPPTPSFSFKSADEGSEEPKQEQGSFWNLSRWRGIPGLRHSNHAHASAQPQSQPQSQGHSQGPNSESADAASQDDAPSNGSVATGRAEQTPKSERVATRRRSFTSGAARAGASSDANRRRSTGIFASELRRRDEAGTNIANGHASKRTEQISNGELDDERQESRDERPVSDLLTDEDEAGCARCGAREFRAKRIGGRQRFLCVHCGTLVDDEGTAP